MSLIPQEEFSHRGGLNLAPMVDFLFIIVAVFAGIAITKAVIYDESIQIVHVEDKKQGKAQNHQTTPSHIINISLSPNGNYKWIQNLSSKIYPSSLQIEHDLLRYAEQKKIPLEDLQILLQIDKDVKWEQMAEFMLSLKDKGIAIYPVYKKNTS